MEVVERAYRLLGVLLALLAIFGFVVPLILKMFEPFGTDVLDYVKPWLAVFDRVIIAFLIIAIVATFTASRRA